MNKSDVAQTLATKIAGLEARADEHSVKAEESSTSQDWYLKKVREYRDARRAVLNAARDLGVTEEV